jgi:hypothetical protein
MQTSRVVLRERCNCSGVLTRRRRFLLGATATRELGVPALARVVRLAATCGLLVALTAPPAFAPAAPASFSEITGNDGEANGFLYFVYEVWDSYGSNSCPTTIVSTAGDSEIVECEVRGDNLTEVIDAIFNDQNGKGLREPDVKGNPRYAGHCIPYFDYQKSVWLDATGQNLVIQISEFTGKSFIGLPKWNPPQGADQADIREWERFRDALQGHEEGHAEINNHGFFALAARGKSLLTGVV